MFTGYNLYEGTDTKEETISLYEDHRKVISITADFPLDLMLISYEDEPNKPVKFGNFHSEVIKYSWVLIGADGKSKTLNNSYGKNGE